ncbi:MAG TPA: type II toxin-antitoxin system RelE/ParE family toxin [Terriglobales bacterium]
MAEGKPGRVHPEVRLEIEAGDDWYLDRSVDASAGFIAAFSEAFETISLAPKRWRKRLHGTQRFMLHRFPFSIIYLDDPDVLSIVAVAHCRRKPGYWKARL